MLHSVKPSFSPTQPVFAGASGNKPFISTQQAVTQDTVTFGAAKAKKAQGRYTTQQIKALAEQFRKDGFVILPKHFSPKLIQKWNKAFQPILKERLANGEVGARGDNRYYITLPFTKPFADPKVYEDPDILALVEELVGKDIVMPQLATDTPLKGSDYQVWHRDTKMKSPNLPDADESYPFQLAVNFPLVKVTTENGPLEVVRGTRLTPLEEVKAKLETGEMKLEQVTMEPGDILIRDVRTIHRGSPNFTDEPRPMVVIGYNPRAHKRPEVSIHIPRAEFEKLSERGKQMLNENPIVESEKDKPRGEGYTDLDFLKKN